MGAIWRGLYRLKGKSSCYSKVTAFLRNTSDDPALPSALALDDPVNVTWPFEKLAVTVRTIYLASIVEDVGRSSECNVFSPETPKGFDPTLKSSGVNTSLDHPVNKG